MNAHSLWPAVIRTTPIRATLIDRNVKNRHKASTTEGVKRM